MDVAIWTLLKKELNLVTLPGIEILLAGSLASIQVLSACSFIIPKS
jgi:hypothetical protein